MDRARQHKVDKQQCSHLGLTVFFNYLYHSGKYMYLPLQRLNTPFLPILVYVSQNELSPFSVAARTRWFVQWRTWLKCIPFLTCKYYPACVPHSSSSTWYDMIWYDVLLPAIGLTPVGSSTVHIYTQTVHRKTQFTNKEECGPCPVFVGYTLEFALQLRKKHGRTWIRLLLPEGQMAQAWELYDKSNALSEVGKHLMEKYFWDFKTNRPSLWYAINK